MTVTELPSATLALRSAPTGRGGINVLASEWIKIRTVRSTFWTLLASVVITIGFAAIVCAVVVAQYGGMSAADRATIEPASISLTGAMLAQLAIAVLGVLVVTNEYSSGMIRTSFSAVPRRLTLLASKVAVFSAVTIAVTTASCFAAFFVGQAILSTKGLGIGIGSPNAVRTIVGTALYLVILGLLALGLGTLIRKTAGAITAVVGVVFVLPAVSSFLPSSMEAVEKYLPSNAGQAILAGGAQTQGPELLSAWLGLGVFALYAVLALAVAAAAVLRRDA